MFSINFAQSVKFSIVSLFFLHLLSGVNSAQESDIATIKSKVSGLRVLKSTRSDFLRLFDAPNHDELRSRENSEVFNIGDIRIFGVFSTGDCSDDNAVWNVKKDVLTNIFIMPDGGEDISPYLPELEDLRKPKVHVDSEGDFIYLDANKGTLLVISDEELDQIAYFPDTKSRKKLCRNENATVFKTDLLQSLSDIKGRVYVCVLVNNPPEITNVILDRNEVFLNCASEYDPKCVPTIRVSAEFRDPDHDVLTFHFQVTVGKITSSGAKAVWDLRGVQPGTYTITVSADDGGGLSEKSITKSITVR